MGISGTGPKRRTSHSKKNKRRAHDALIPINPSVCSNCGAAAMPHRVCTHCGFYRGRRIIVIKE
jgi:large subunit ribosomal protein L32